jgi:hypothetical protein
LNTNWSIGGTKQKGIIHWGISANRQNVLAGVGHDAVFNTFRRTRAQLGYWLPPVILGYYLLNWATEKYGRQQPISTIDLFANQAPQERVSQLQGWPCRGWQRRIEAQWGTHVGLGGPYGPIVHQTLDLGKQ